MIPRSERLASARREAAERAQKHEADRQARAALQREHERAATAREALLACTDRKEVLALWKAYRDALDATRAMREVASVAHSDAIAAEDRRRDAGPVSFGPIGAV